MYFYRPDFKSYKVVICETSFNTYFCTALVRIGMPSGVVTFWTLE